jgi:D-glycero-D-manno-heptose 1,7-bisphosphate phosphatase
LIEEMNYLSDPGQVVLLPGAAQGLRSLAEAGFGIVLVTNQSGIARGYFDWDTLNAIHEVLRGLLIREDVVLDGIYVCPHQPKDDCSCRKPRPGLALAAAKELGFDPRDCVVVGDKACDVELGRNISAATVLVGTGHGVEQSLATRSLADWSVPSLAEACGVILEWDRGDAPAGKERVRNG